MLRVWEFGNGAVQSGELDRANWTVVGPRGGWLALELGASLDRAKARACRGGKWYIWYDGVGQEGFWGSNPTGLLGTSEFWPKLALEGQFQ